MKVDAILWDYRPTQEGEYPIRFYAYANGKKRYYPTGIRVKPENWSKSNQKVIGLPQPIKDNYNQFLERGRLKLLERLMSGVPIGQLMTKEEKKSQSVVNFLSQYISEMENGMHGIKVNTIGTYRSVHTRLEQYCIEKGIKDLSFDDIDMEWYTDYFNFVAKHELGITSFDKTIKILKKIMRVAFERGLHKNKAYELSQFRRHRKIADKIYLTASEIEKIEQLDLTTMEHLARERDRFLISYYFVMRWEDSTRINKESVLEHNGLNYDYVQGKTGVKCLVPISKRAKILLEKRDYSFDADSNQKANQKIKEICMLAGITQLAKQNGVRAPKFKFVTTHTARRSAATNLYLQGMDLETIARVGGWKRLETLKRYLKASGLEVAQNAKKFEFFK